MLPDVVARLTSPDLARLERARREVRHFEAERLRWAAAFIFEAIRRGVAQGYIHAKAQIGAKGKPPEWEGPFAESLDWIPGYRAPKKR